MSIERMRERLGRRGGRVSSTDVLGLLVYYPQIREYLNVVIGAADVDADLRHIWSCAVIGTRSSLSDSRPQTGGALGIPG